MDEQRRTLAARREHSKGDGNFPDPEPTVTVMERAEDRTPEDLPKGRDRRSAPKGNVTKGQIDRNPTLEARDDFRPELPTPESGFEEALDAAEEATSEAAPAPAARPNARRSSSAKREALPKQRSRPPVEAKVGRAPKSAAKSGKRAAVARRAQPGKRKTGAARRGGAVTKAARGSVTARKKAKAARAKGRRAR